MKLVLAILLIGLSACAEMNGQRQNPEHQDLLERMMERSAPRLAAGTEAPGFMVDPSWPKPLPNNWTIGQIGGLSIDSEDNIWVYHRGRTVAQSSAYASGIVGTDAEGLPVNGLGHSRQLADRIAGCCEIAPAVLKFDPAGNLLASWGGPQDPGFLEIRCREEDGCIWPGTEHGIYVDHNNFVYLSGNGPASSGRFPWEATHGADSHILKFSAEGEFIFQIGFAGVDTADSENIDGGPNGTPQPFRVADMMVDSETNQMYVADGYGNSRVLVLDAATGLHIRHFGAYGQNPVADPSNVPSDPYYAGAWVEDYNSGNTKPNFFRSPLHCTELSKDGLLYACDRGNNRIQVFDVQTAGRGQCANPDGETGLCGFIADIPVAPYTAGGTVVSVAFSSDAEQSCIYAGDLTNGTFYIINRENHTELDRIGRAGRQAGEFHWLHILATDSEGNIYTGEVDTNPRIQKFIRYGSESCSGTGYTDIGAYERNR